MTLPEQLPGWPVSVYGWSGWGCPTVVNLDGYGSNEVFINADRVYGFSADGSEILDGDGDAATTGVWSDLGSAYWSKPAIGDLDGDGHLEVVATSRYEEGTSGTGHVFVWNDEGEPLWYAVPGASNFLMASPVIADIDEDDEAEVITQLRGAIYAWNHDGSPVDPGSLDGRLLYVGASRHTSGMAATTAAAGSVPESTGCALRGGREQRRKSSFCCGSDSAGSSPALFLSPLCLHRLTAGPESDILIAQPGGSNMLLSMTGYGRAEARDGERTLAVEIRSVNHRFAEISVRLPKSLSSLEARVREKIQKRLSRGKITCSVALDGENGELGNLTVDQVVAERYAAILRELKEKLNLSGELDLSTFVSLPDVLSWEKDALDEEAGWKLLEKPLMEAIEDLTRMKAREGGLLASDLRQRIEAILDGIAKIEVEIPKMIDSVRERLRDRLEELLKDQEIEYQRNRLEAEIALFADRTDCTEECVRLRAHCEQFTEMLDSEQPVGRKLNFLLQEMNREANTIGSKSSHVDIARKVIGIKEEAERLREQVANIE